MGRNLLLLDVRADCSLLCHSLLRLLLLLPLLLLGSLTNATVNTCYTIFYNVEFSGVHCNHVGEK